LETTPSMIGASNITENGTIGTSPQKQDIVTTEKIEQLTANNTQELNNSTLANFTASNPENVTNFTEKVASNQTSNQTGNQS
jgi:hypothetical protein